MTEKKTTSLLPPPEWPDVSDAATRKCPRHKEWIKSIRMGDGDDRYYVRYCPRCDLEKQMYKAYVEKHSPSAPAPPKPKLRIMKL